MYQYDQYDQRLVRERVAQFRDQLRRYLRNELDDEQFKQLRLRNGLYLQRHAYMLRVAIPYGVLSARQLRALAEIARRYDRGFGHFTTRQNIQFNWPELEDVPDILERLAEVEMHAIQTSGNCIRNITADHLAGIAADELEDPRPYCELLRQWSTLHPEFSWLPRKFKIAISGAAEDRTAGRLHDIALRLVANDHGERGFQVLVGGGMGRIPVVAKVIREFLPRADLLSYVEAILRVYNLHGRRDNPQRARIKILVNALGVDRFRDLVEQAWQSIRPTSLRLSGSDIDGMRKFFPRPAYDDDAAADERVQRWTLDTRFADWLRHNTLAHKASGYRIVYVSLKAPGRPPGDVTAAQMDVIADLAERYSFGEIRASHEQNLVLPHVRGKDLVDLWRELDRAELATPNIGTLNDMICCPGLDFCALANAGTIDVARQINARFADLGHLRDLGEIKLKMSGCMNACGHHHVGHIGILGVDKRGEQWYQLTLGGSAADDAALGERLGPAVPKEAVADTLVAILEAYVAKRRPGEGFLDAYRRLGIDSFREHVYADHQRSGDYRQPVAALAG